MDFDYANMPYLPREGIVNPVNNNPLTKSLFYETAPPEKLAEARWSLSETAKYDNGKWYPSAWMVYIEAEDEYDALMKLCGNVRQWERIKAMSVPGRGKFGEAILPYWQEEQAMRQRTRLRNALMEGALAMKPGYTSAARMLLQMIDAPVRGRPKKAKPPKAEIPAQVEADSARIITFRK